MTDQTKIPLPKDGDSLIERAVESFGWNRFAPPPDMVARVIVSAIESSRPLRRYLVGADAVTIASTHPFIPRALTDAATRLISGLGGGPSTYT